MLLLMLLRMLMRLQHRLLILQHNRQHSSRPLFFFGSLWPSSIDRLRCPRHSVPLPLRCLQLEQHRLRHPRPSFGRPRMLSPSTQLLRSKRPHSQSLSQRATCPLELLLVAVVLVLDFASELVLVALSASALALLSALVSASALPALSALPSEMASVFSSVFSLAPKSEHLLALLSVLPLALTLVPLSALALAVELATLLAGWSALALAVLSAVVLGPALAVLSALASARALALVLGLALAVLSALA
jgi:hypothetical protein